MKSPVTNVGVRSTKQRTAVVDALSRIDDFRSCQELHDTLRGADQEVGLTTVYRTLQALVDTGDVDVIVRADGESVYRLCSRHHHHHLICRNCRATVEVEAPEVETWAESVAREHGFADPTHIVEIWGLCADCAEPSS
ncbi:MAG: Fur family transcriptional regulator [Candidatus Nanopelagicales bacterium]